jgi:hypothetical protein
MTGRMSDTWIFGALGGIHYCMHLGISIHNHYDFILPAERSVKFFDFEMIIIRTIKQHYICSRVVHHFTVFTISFQSFLSSSVNDFH